MAVAGRALRNRLIDEMGDAEALDFPAQASLARALLQANSDAVRRAFLPLWAGQATPLIRDLPAATFIDTLVAQTRGRLPSVSKKPPHGTHFCCWHFSDLTASSNVHFAPTAVVPQSLFPRIEPRQHRLRQSLACQIGLALSTHLSAVTPKHSLQLLTLAVAVFSLDLRVHRPASID
jgi:hypothetical protein